MCSSVAVFDNVSTSALSMSHEIHSHIQSCVWCVTKLCVTKCVADCSSVAVFDNVSTSALRMSHEIHSHIQSCVWQCRKCHACHQVPRLQRKTHHQSQPSAPSVTPATPAAKWRGARGDHQARAQARHQSQPSAASATPATQNEGRCHQVPRLPRETKMSPSATPATRNHGGCHQVWQSCVAKLCVKDGVWQSCVSEMVCERWCVTKLCEWDGVWKMVCDKVVWVRWCVKDGVWQSCVSEMVCERWCATKVSGADGTGSGIQNQKQEPHTKMWGKTKTKKRGEKNEKKQPKNRLAYLYNYGEGLFFFPGICVLNCEGFTNGTPTLYNSFWNSHLLLG